MSAASLFADLQAYVGFSDDDARALVAFHAIAAPHFDAVLDDFYDAIERDPRARAVLTGGPPQIARLKQTLRRWLEELLRGPHDAAYAARRARIGRVHVQISLPQEFMLTAASRVRARLMAVLLEAPALDLPSRARTATAIDRILDLDLALMLDSYREDLLARNLASERLATIGQFAAGIGHELRSPLGVIESSAFLLRQRLGVAAADEGVRRHLDRIEGEVKRSSKTITDLLELVRSRPPRRVRLRVRPLLDDAIAAAELPAGIQVEVACPDDLQAEVDPDQLLHVLTNLLGNAAQAMAELPPEATPRVRISAWREEGHLGVRIQDAGPGVPPELRDQIFVPLFTTRPRGTGLGLALARKIVEAHGGRLELEAPERAPTDLPGASFLVVL